MTSPIRQAQRGARDRRWRPAGLILVASLVVVACEGVEPPPPPTAPILPATPASLVLTASSGFNDQLAVSARVLSLDGRAVPNVTVAFSIGAGSITPPTAPTDADGTAHATAVSTANTTISAAIESGIASSMPVLRSLQTE
jgi:Bacterial Ig-like domain (group 1)